MKTKFDQMIKRSNRQERLERPKTPAQTSPAASNRQAKLERPKTPAQTSLAASNRQAKLERQKRQRKQALRPQTNSKNNPLRSLTREREKK